PLSGRAGAVAIARVVAPGEGDRSREQDCAEEPGGGPREPLSPAPSERDDGTDERNDARDDCRQGPPRRIRRGQGRRDEPPEPGLARQPTSAAHGIESLHGGHDPLGKLAAAEPRPDQTVTTLSSPTVVHSTPRGP